MRRRRAFSISKASSLMQAFEAAMDWIGADADNYQFWFRGVNCTDYKLTPGAYWRNDYDEMRNLIYLVQEGRAYTQVGELEEWRTYYLAQHHGIPTRLLDWTESFTSALFFALDGWESSKTPCVWILCPDLLNKFSFGWTGVMTPEQNRELDIWLPRALSKGAIIQTVDGYTYDSGRPVAIYPRRDNPRVLAQQGTFTVHGHSRSPLEEWISSQDHGDRVLHRIDLKIKNPRKTLDQLSALGVRRHFIYPDIDNYVRYLKQRNAW